LLPTNAPYDFKYEDRTFYYLVPAEGKSRKASTGRVVFQFGSSLEWRYPETPRFHQRGEGSRAGYSKLAHYRWQVRQSNSTSVTELPQPR
jgi:hypothetical protein